MLEQYLIDPIGEPAELAAHRGERSDQPRDALAGHAGAAHGEACVSKAFLENRALQAKTFSPGTTRSGLRRPSAGSPMERSRFRSYAPSPVSSTRRPSLPAAMHTTTP